MAGPREQERRFEDCSVLLVEDDQALREMYAMALQALDVRLVIAEDGPTALKLLACGPVNLVLMDIGLPGMTGLEVVATYVRKAVTPSPVVFLTNQDDPWARARARDLGALDYLLKIETTPHALGEYVAARLAYAAVPAAQAG